MSRKDSFAVTRLSFVNFYQLVDALMLFGARIEVSRSGSEYRMRLMRASPQAWPAMIWAIIVAESQDPLFDFLLFKCGTVATDESLAMTTRFSKFLKPSYDAWYAEGMLRLPENFQLTEPQMIYWIVGSLGRWRGAGALTLQGPEVKYGDPSALAEQASKLTGLNVTVTKDRRLQIVDMDTAMTWLKETVPASVWS